MLPDASNESSIYLFKNYMHIIIYEAYHKSHKQKEVGKPLRPWPLLKASRLLFKHNCGVQTNLEIHQIIKSNFECFCHNHIQS